MFCESEVQKTCFFSDDNCYPTLYSLTNNGWSLRPVENTWKQFFFVSNKLMSSCVICLVIAREIFLLLDSGSIICETSPPLLLLV